MQIDFIARYFQGERHEMFAIVAGSALLLLLAGAILLLSRDPFAKALFVTVLVSAVLLSGTALSLLPRDARLHAELNTATQSAQAASALTGERVRVEEILSKYQYYRYAAALFGLIALAAVVLSRKGWAHGVAAGLLLLVVAQVIIDHYSEQRARQYHEELARAWPSTAMIVVERA